MAKWRSSVASLLLRYTGEGQEGQVVAPLMSGRKVRTPLGKVLGNAQAP
jgi:hypothetical protein